ncbi:hypothetical protein bpr_IV189 (plasmid) [Butyrivibrio proteoclasticus B316]|uniref:Uncharacterized protein n=1 Tax=Butyrivibrio proteoclasticus (strain ATCC 51982 / DSM 14932 / B316) TaxID=515622 RepID=E0S571_BUTPB|nr:hypothetical protein [Butyrivibrio proteoclasticus]ADL36553.1 hypothetical protein bpr_IV189 [Butyrivibrio proteoclasticus B316]
MSERKNEEKNLLAAYYGKKAFVKIKQCLEIGKIQFSFVDLNNTKDHIDCYMLAEEFGAILMASITDKSLLKAIMDEKAKGEQYPKPIWMSPVGGNATGNNGKPISRYFEIAPGSSSEVLFTAYSFPAEQNDNGAFIKVKGSKAILTLRVPCTFNDLKVLQYKWSFLEKDYMSEKYSLLNMKSDYQPRYEDTYASESAEEKEKAIEAKMKTIRLVATSALEPVKGKSNIKVCQVTENGNIHRLICLMDKIADKKKLSSFESQLNSRVSANGTLEFSAEVAEKDSDYYLTRFA